MANLARTAPRPAARVGQAPTRTKLLLIRQPVKSVRKSDEPDRSMFRLALGVIVGVGIIAAIWLLGYLGYRLGFAELVRVRDLKIEGGGGLATGTMMLIALPRVVFEAGVVSPMWLMLGFALIAIPAGSLGGIKPVTPGGPKPKPAVVVLAYVGAVAAGLNAIALIAWTVSTMRNGLVAELPMRPDGAAEWLANLQMVGALDALGTVTAALWVVVVMRLPIPRWTRGLTASAAFFALVVMAVAMSKSNATVAQVTTDRSVIVQTGEGADAGRLVLGFTPEYLATMYVHDGRTLIELSDQPTRLTVLAKTSIIEYLTERTPPPQE